MIASVLKLKRADWKALGLKDLYGIHKVVYSLFPKQNDKTRDFLFADKGGDWNFRQVLILSECTPATPEFGEIVSKKIPESFLKWDDYGFEVVVNPTERNGPSKTTKPIRGVENLRAWFLQKTPAWGFEVMPNSLQISNMGVQTFNKIKEGATFSHTHGSAKFIGRLKVIDRQVFVASFKQGIGRAKGFGFGLLQIVPIQK